MSRISVQVKKVFPLPWFYRNCCNLLVKFEYTTFDSGGKMSEKTDNVRLNLISKERVYCQKYHKVFLPKSVQVVLSVGLFHIPYIDKKWLLIYNTGVDTFFFLEMGKNKILTFKYQSCFCILHLVRLLWVQVI